MPGGADPKVKPVAPAAKPADGGSAAVESALELNPGDVAELFSVLVNNGPDRIQKALNALGTWSRADAIGLVQFGATVRNWSADNAPCTLCEGDQLVQDNLDQIGFCRTDDLQREIRLKGLAAANPDIHGAIVAPLNGHDNVLGCLLIGQREKSAPLNGVHDIVQSFANALGASIGRERRIEEHQERYKQLMEQAADSIFMLDSRLGIVDVNKMCCEMLGYERHELLKMELTDILDPEELAYNPVPYLGNPGDMLSTERIMLRKDGTPVLVEANVTLLDNGLIQGIARDIGERKANELELKAHVRLLDSMQLVQAEYIGAATPTVPFREVLQQLLTLTRSELGFVAEVRPKDQGFELVRYAAGGPETVVEGSKRLPSWLDKNSLLGVLGRLEDGAELLVEQGRIAGSPEDDPKATLEYIALPLRTRRGLAGVACLAESRDSVGAEMASYLRPFLTTCANIILARRAAQAQQLAEAEAARLGHILDHASNEILVFEGTDYHFIEANDGARSNLGYELEEILAMTPMAILPHIGKEHFSSMLALLRDGRQEQVSFETMVKRRNNTLYPVEVSLQIAQPEGTEYFVVIMQDISIRKQAEERVTYLVHHDRLTGLPNRIGFIDRLDQVLGDAARDGSYVAVLFVDLDRFQTINDTLGHEAGDLLIKLVAERLQPLARPGDTLARLGGDEFTVILPEVEPIEEVARFAQRVLDAFEKPFVLHEHEVFTAASIGITLFPIDATDITGLLKNADTALAHAKRSGRNTYQFFTNEMNARAIEKLALETELRRALDRDELVVHYQPQINLSTGRITGVEALLRWNHPRLGLVSPSSFIPLAEETGLIIALGEWVLHTACKQVVHWHALGHEHLRVAVNLSARQLVKQILPTLHETVKASGIDPRCVELELTESLLMEDDPNSIQALRELQAFGIGFSIDDFGTGYSSLGYLKQLPIDTLKIDRSFVRDVIRDPDDAAIAKAIIAMAHGLGIRVIAEGVETRAQLEFLQQHRCDAFQGYYFSPPLPANELTRLLQEGRSLRDC